MAKRGTARSRVKVSHTISKPDLAKAVRAIRAMQPPAPPRLHTGVLNARRKHVARDRALRSKVGALITGKAEIARAKALIADYNKTSAALFRKEAVAARKSFLASNKAPRGRVISPYAAATTPHLAAFGNRSAYYLLRPIAIVARPASMLWATSVPGGEDVLAKIYYSSRKAETKNLTLDFWYLWVNTAPHTQTVNVNCPVSFRGVCRCTADRGLFWGGESLIHGEIRLDMFEWWKPGHPRVHNSITFDTLQSVVDMGIDTGGVFSDNVETINPVEQYQQLHHGGIAVPPGEWLMCRIHVWFLCIVTGSGGINGGGSISVDFGSDPTYAIIPTMVIEALNPNPPLNPDLLDTPVLGF